MPAEEKGFTLVKSLCGRHKDLFFKGCQHGFRG